MAKAISWESKSPTPNLSKREWLEKHYQHMLDVDMAAELGVSQYAVRKARFRFGLKKGAPPAKNPPLPPALSMDDILIDPSEDLGFEDYIELIQTHQGILKSGVERSPRIIEIDIATDKPIAIAMTSDWHFGSLATDYDAWRRDIDFIRGNDRIYMGLLGDLLDNFHTFPNRAAIFSQAISPELQQKMLRSLLLELLKAKKLLWAGLLHHEAWDEKSIGYAVLKLMVDQYNVPWADERARIMLRLNKGTDHEVVYRIIAMHKGRYSSVLNDLHSPQQEHRYRYPFADAVITAHQHSPAISEVVRYPEAEEMDLDMVPQTIFARCGTYKTGNDTYSDKFGKSVMGNPILIFHPDRKHISYTLDGEDALRLLG